MRMQGIVLLCGLCQALKTVNQKLFDSEILAAGGLVFNIEEGLSNRSSDDVTFPPMQLTGRTPNASSSAPAVPRRRPPSAHAAQAMAAMEAMRGAPARGEVREASESLDEILYAVKANFDQVLNKRPKLVDITDEGVVILTALDKNTIPFKDNFPKRPNGTESAKAVLVDENGKREVAENTLDALRELLTIVGVDRILVQGNSVKKDPVEKERLIMNRNKWILEQLRPVLTDDLYAREAVQGKDGGKDEVSCSITVTTVLDVRLLKEMGPTGERLLSREDLQRKMMQAKNTLGEVKKLLAENKHLVRLHVNPDKTVSVQLPQINEKIPFDPIPKTSYDDALFFISRMTHDPGDQLTGVAENERDNILDTLKVLGDILTQVGVFHMEVNAFSKLGPQEKKDQQGLRAIITMTRATNVVQYLLFRGVNLNRVLGSEAVDAWRCWFDRQNKEPWATWLLGVEPEQIINFWKRNDAKFAVIRRVFFPSLGRPPREITNAIKDAVKSWDMLEIAKLEDMKGANPMSVGLLKYHDKGSLPIHITLANKIKQDFRVEITITPCLNPYAL